MRNGDDGCVAHVRNRYMTGNIRRFHRHKTVTNQSSILWFGRCTAEPKTSAVELHSPEEEKLSDRHMEKNGSADDADRGWGAICVISDMCG